MTIAESYARAQHASRIKWELTLTDVDYLLAAGLVTESLATRLLRLRSEFDTINRKSLRDASTPLTARLLTLTRLKSLPIARYRLGEYAQREAVARNARLTEAEVSLVAGKVLDLFVDPTCPECAGKGFTGNHRAPKVRCIHCKETGKRLPRWANDRHEAFGRWLAGRIDAKLQRALGEMKRHLRQ